MGVSEISRRSTLKLMFAAGGLTFAFPKSLMADEDNGLASANMDVPLVKIHPDNSATIYNPAPDLGQGTSTGHSMLLADEMGLEWSSISVEEMPLYRHRRADGLMAHTYYPQSAGGSGTTRRAWTAIRQVGAKGRHMFLSAAAKSWGVPVNQLDTENSHVVNGSTGARIAFSDLLNDVAKLPIPEGDLPLKPKSDLNLVGKPQRIKAGHGIVTGKPMFGIDQQMEGMLHAVIERCPHFGGSVRSFNADAARAVDGVVRIVEMQQGYPDGEYSWNLNAGIAVVAKSLWAAKKARALLEIKWDQGPFAGYSSAEMERKSLEELDKNDGFEIIKYGDDVRDEGNVDTAIQAADRKLSRKYAMAHIAHALMEPHSVIADVRENSAHIISPTQAPYMIQQAAAKLTGLRESQITVDVARSGGSFGRRYTQDFPSEAIVLSQIMRKPVKVTWSREDELTQDNYRNANNYRMEGAVDDKGKLVALHQRQASGYQSIYSHKLPPVAWPYEDLMGWHSELGMFEHHRMEHKFFPSPVPRGAWRAPGSVNTCFAQMSFFDEFAHELGIDPLEFQLSILEPSRKLGTSENYPLDTARMAACFRKAAEEAGWGKEMPSGRGMGIAGCYSHVSYVALVMEVAVSDGELVIDRVVAAVDCGFVVNPLSVRAQVEGAVHDGISVALSQEISVVDAAVQETNFDSYEMARMDRAPRQFEIHLMEGADAPTGIGEPAMPPTAPALTNAIFAATGKRIRRLPIADQLTA